MSNLYEHPDITRALKTGYHSSYEPVETCPWCGGSMGTTGYLISGDRVCVDCFREWVADYLVTNPKEAAEHLCIETEDIIC